MGSDGHSWFALRRSARDMPYFRDTPGKESLGDTYDRSHSRLTRVSTPFWKTRTCLMNDNDPLTRPCTSRRRGDQLFPAVPIARLTSRRCL